MVWAVLTTVVCGVPLTVEMLAGVPAVLVSEKFAGAATPAVAAAIVYGPPAVAFAVAVTCVWPAALVTAGAESTADAPAPGGVKVTVRPATGFPNASRTTTMRGAPKAALAAADCGVPLTTETDAGAPAVFVNTKVAVKAPMVAVTLNGPPATVFAVAVRLT